MNKYQINDLFSSPPHRLGCQCWHCRTEREEMELPQVIIDADYEPDKAMSRIDKLIKDASEL